MPVLHIVHMPECPHDLAEIPPSLVTRWTPSASGDTLMVQVWEECDSCRQTTGYASGRMPARRFHREWRASLAVWFATWEHRHNVWGRVTTS